MLNLARKKIENLLGIRFIKVKGSMFSERDYALASTEVKQPIFLNLGGAEFKRPYWKTTDMRSKHYETRQKKNDLIELDLSEISEYPFESCSFDAIYCTQVCEHLPYEAVEHMFKEAYRILRPGGSFRVACPDADLCIAAYIRNDRLFWAPVLEYYSKNKRWQKNFLADPNTVAIEQLLLNTLFSSLSALRSKGHVSSDEVMERFTSNPEEALSYFERICVYDRQMPQLHVSYWNAKRFHEVSQKTQFSQCYRSAFNQSWSPILRRVEFERAAYTHHNIYFECAK